MTSTLHQDSFFICFYYSFHRHRPTHHWKSSTWHFTVTEPWPSITSSHPIPCNDIRPLRERESKNVRKTKIKEDFRRVVASLWRVVAKSYFLRLSRVVTGPYPHWKQMWRWFATPSISVLTSSDCFEEMFLCAQGSQSKSVYNTWMKWFAQFSWVALAGPWSSIWDSIILMMT